MPTNEERREDAKKLSGYNPEWLSLRNLSKETIVNYCLLWRALEESFPDINENVHIITDKLYRLADLIEPEPERMCHMTKIGGDKVLAGWWKCSECGPVYPPCEDEIAKWALQRCPRCGAKVVDE